MKKILLTFSKIVIFLFILSLFGWMVKQISSENKKFGFLTGPIKFMYTFPDLFSQSVEEVKTLPKTFIPTPKNFKPINKLKEDLFVLVTYTDAKKSRAIVKMNLKNDSIIRKWTFKNPYEEHDRIINPILYADGSLIYTFDYKRYGLIKIDSSGNQLWKQDSATIHHGMEANKDGDIWACSKIPGWKATGTYILGGRKVFYNDYTITKIDHETGKILFNKSISEILKENNLSNYLLKSSNPIDPIHLNDVQPAFKTTQYYKDDDVFISLRNMSIVLHYRPTTNELINLIEGPFISQHDVDVLDNNSIAVFNNNFYVSWSNASKKPHKKKKRLVNSGKFYSNIVSYNFETDKFSFIGDSLFIENEIFTETEGLFEFIDPTTYFVEEQNSGILWIIQDNEVIYKNVLKSQHQGHHHLPNWTRIIKTKYYD